KMNYTRTEGEQKVPDDELECKICCRRFTIHSRKPKILDCLHRICARCLTKILHTGAGSPCISCPFCRHETELNEDEVEGLPTDTNIMSKLILKYKTARNSGCKEVVLTPKNLPSSSFSHGSPNHLVITITEVQRDPPRPPSHSSTSGYYAAHGTESVSPGSPRQLNQDLSSKLCRHVSTILVWLLGFLYFSSIPVGIYLLVIQKVIPGVVCVTFVPFSLFVCTMCNFCYRLCHAVCDSFSQ
ncbi:RN182 ligase, partial [Phaetusa simplex]|nr:RN182 ligase [Phaetusa simplex]